MSGVRKWRAAQREVAREYLARQGVRHGPLAARPAFEVAPYVVLWAVESLKAPVQVGWWVVTGDLPTDYLSSRDGREAREGSTSRPAWLAARRVRT